MTPMPASPFSNSTAISPRAVESAVAFSDPSGSDATAAPFAEPSMTNGGDQGTPASAPTKNPDVGVLADRIDWNEFFEAVMDERVVLFEPFEEPLPLFIRAGDHLRRWSA